MPATSKNGGRGLFRQLYFQVMLGVALGILVGVCFPKFGESLKPFGDGFVKLVRMLLTPVIFGTIVVGIARMSNLRELGRVGLVALIYFEIVSTFSLLLGMAVVNYVQPGAGMHVNPATLDTRALDAYTSAAKPQDAVGFFLDIIPSSVVDAFARGNILQVIFFSVLFGVALALIPERGRAAVEAIDSVLCGLFKVVRLIMYLAPLGAFGAMAFTIGKYGPGALKPYLRLIIALYATCLGFVFIVLAVIARVNGLSLWKFLKFIKDEIVLVFATASTEAALPQMMEKMEQLGCAKPVVGIVLPAGYTFNADGTSIYMAMGALFVAQATDTTLTLRDQLIVLGVLMFTSKGSAGVAGSGFITLAATLASLDKIPAAGMVLLLGVDRALNEARAVVNLIGNGVATVVVARWEKAYDEKRANSLLDGKREAGKKDL